MRHDTRKEPCLHQPEEESSSIYALFVRDGGMARQHGTPSEHDPGLESPRGHLLEEEVARQLEYDVRDLIV